MTAKIKADPDKLKAETEHYDGLAGQDAPETTEYVRKNRSRSVVYSLRLNPEDVAEIERLAAELDAPATSIVRGFVLKGLAEQREATPAALIERLGHDVDQLRTVLSIANPVRVQPRRK